jgi:hypothetical protein
MEPEVEDLYGYTHTVNFADGTSAGIMALTYGRARIVHYRGWFVLTGW